jgi:hypothetical protein
MPRYVNQCGLGIEKAFGFTRYPDLADDKESGKVQGVT